jgi:DNA polymerase
MKRFLFLDFETYSETDIGKCGSYKYMEDPRFEVLLLAYAFNDKPVDVVDFAQGESWPSDFMSALTDPDTIKVAHNAAFERYAIWRSLGVYCDPVQWFDTMHLCGVCGLPMSLAGAGEALGLGEDQAKMKEGKALIRYFCLPCKPTKVNGQRTRNLPEHAPEKWLTFKDYCGRDVEVERTIFNMLKRWAPDPVEKQFWNLDTRINERGVRIDRQMAVNAIAMDLKYKEELTEQAVAISGLENPKSVSQIKNWLYDQEGKEFPSLNKKVIADVVSQLQSDEAKEFMAIRTELSKSSVAKYDAMVRAQCEDETVKGCFLFYGASRTGRFAGRLVQFQNLPQNHMDTLAEARSLVKGGHYTAMKALYGSITNPLSELIRTAIIPEDGHQLLVCDYAAIEARITSWFSQEQWRLDVFKNGGDIYCASASQMFHIPVEKHGQNAHLRQKGKVVELALGYGGGVNALKAFGADKMGMSEQEMQETVDLWRESSPGVVAMWRALEKAAIRSVVRRGSVDCPLPGATVRFDFENGILWMALPSGRRIAYYGARYEPDKYHPDRKVLSYMGTDQKTKKWARLSTWGGKLTENLVQATARDCLRESMMALDAEGYDIRAHVHDEIIVTEPLDGRSVEQMSEVMGRPIPWAPGLPLRADGYSCPFYQKD